MVQQAVQQGGGDHVVAERLSPLTEAAVGGQDHGALLVARVHQLDEQVRATGFQRQVADSVDDQQRGPGQETQPCGQVSLPLRLDQRGDDLGKGGEEHALARPDGLEAQHDGQVRLAGPWGSEQMDHGGAVDEGQLGQRQDAIAVQGRLEGEVEAVEHFHPRQPRGHRSRLQAALLTGALLLAEQVFEHLQS